jgi:putative nucleotidyltransferase with HDIG domain
MGFIPVFEWMTGITTDQTLLEWADPNRPLLRRLSLEAPGTYAHTINVANIGEAAAGVIGANGLLCRVGIYYHDVGKMLKPQYFVENQPGGRNPHDKLKPDTSASIIREHVLGGLRLAREEGIFVGMSSGASIHAAMQVVSAEVRTDVSLYGGQIAEPTQRKSIDRSGDEAIRGDESAARPSRDDGASYSGEHVGGDGRITSRPRTRDRKTVHDPMLSRQREKRISIQVHLIELKSRAL